MILKVNNMGVDSDILVALELYVKVWCKYAIKFILIFKIIISFLSNNNVNK